MTPDAAVRRLRRAGLEIPEDRQQAAVVSPRRGEVEFGEDRADVGLDGLLAHGPPLGHRVIRPTFGHQGEDGALPLGQPVEPARRPLAPQQSADDERVDRTSSGADPAHRVRQSATSDTRSLRRYPSPSAPSAMSRET